MKTILLLGAAIPVKIEYRQTQNGQDNKKNGGKLVRKLQYKGIKPKEIRGRAREEYNQYIGQQKEQCQFTLVQACDLLTPDRVDFALANR